MPRFLLVDDHPVVREGIARVLASAFPDVTLGAASTAQEALAGIESAAWDLVVLDLTLDGDDGLLLLKRLRQRYPAVPVVVVSMHPADQFARRVVHAGASGYVSKGSDPDELVRAIRAALSGAPPATPLPDEGEAAVEQPRHERLSDREYQVLRMIGQGLTVTQIAAQLSLSVKTVSTYRARILEKMAMRTSAELMRYVIAHRLVPWPPES